MAETRIAWRRVLLGVSALLVVLGILWLPSVYGDFLWFGAVGYESVFLKILGYQVALFLIATAVSFALLYGSYYLARENIREATGAPPSPVYILGIAGLALFVGLRYVFAWDIVIRFLNATPFGVTDPIFGREVAFYAFTLPFVDLVLGYLRLVVTLGLLLAIGLYARYFGVVEQETPTGDVSAFNVGVFLSELRRHAFGHVVALAGVFLILVGIGYFIDRYELVYSTRGVVFGLGATDQTIFETLLILLAITGILGGLAMISGVWLQDGRLVYIPVAAIIGLLVLGSVGGAVYQSFVVEPDEFNKERPYIEHEIEFTNRAFALDRIEENEFPVSETISAEEIEDNPGTIDNVRLWDPRPLLTTYNELQIFRTYYQFADVDVDRYEIDGEETQVMVSAREIDFEALPSQSQSWVNRHLVYTHGYGIAMSPVGSTTGEGLPELYVRDIPPNSSVGIDVTQPRIYYGEPTENYTIVDTRTRELDYPSGDQNVYTTYDGGGGVVLDSALDELVYTIKFGAPSIILSDSLTSDSRIQFNRDIETRANTIAPFLEYDDDPYIVVSNGKLYWIYDAYTTTDRYPYSRQIEFKGQSTNYVRNSVKVVVDAHTGETTYYVADEDDPLIRTYEKAFPSLFADIDEMPPDLRDHIRYPEDAFRVQAQMYLDYHMKDPNVFYNKEDAWRIPDEVVRGDRQPMDPYYIIMSFPDQNDPEFVMIQPYIPRGKENMIGWLAARSDRPNYGQLRAYLFSKQELIFGPMQIESRIDQDTEISQRITLWSQAGSSVIRGNLLAIPVEDTVIYVEPLFLESQEAGSLPELKRVILAQGDRLTMQPSFQDALAVRFGTARPAEPTGPQTGVTPGELQRLQTLYQEAQTALQEGDFETYAEKITELGEELEEIETGQTGNATIGGAGNTTTGGTGNATAVGG